MKGDFTRWTFDASKQYSSVRLQQGRVLLDSDWNEQLDISAYRETTANQEIIGLCGVPDFKSFAPQISDDTQGIKLGQGICYVDGILCENSEEQTYSLKNKEKVNYLVYLEVWQHHITAIEAPELREQALGGPDTTTRTQTYWRVQFSKFNTGKNETTDKWQVKWQTLQNEKKQKGKLTVGATGTTLPNDLYRVQIHKGESKNDQNTTTFKWARNNGSVAARVESIESQRVTIISNPQANKFEVGNWIEITDEERVKGGLEGFFAKINNIQGNDLILDPTAGDVEDIPEAGLDPQSKITTVRIWGAEASTIVVAEGGEEYITLENGLKVKFNEDGNYRTGDYWLIPTRSQEQVDWPDEGKEPDGIDYHYCPLAIVRYNSDSGNWKLVKDCRYVFPAITEVARATAIKNGGAIKGTELSLGVHSYNDSRRADARTKAKHIEDNLDIQGGKHLKLNVGFWQDELDEEESWPPNGDRVEGMDFCVSDRPRMLLDQYGRLSIGPGDDGSGPNPPEAWLDLQPKWESAEPPANGNGEYIGLHINPTFPAGVDESKKYALKVENGHVDIGDWVDLSGDLTVTGKSHLQNIVSIGTEPPQADGEETIGLNVKPQLTVPANASEVVGLRLEPTLIASDDDDRLTGLHINPVFENSSQSDVKRYGLIVENGKVGIGTIDPTAGLDLRPTLDASTDNEHLTGLLINPDFQHHSQSGVKDYGLIVEEGKVGIGGQLNTHESIDDIGVEVRSSLRASNNSDKLVGLYIQPNFDDNGKNPVEHYGLIVEEGKVAIGPHNSLGYPVEIDGTGSKVENLRVTGNLEVIGDVTYRGEVTAYAVEKAAGEIRLGDDDRDLLVIHGTMSSEHTSGKLKLTSPLEIQLDKNTQGDFLSLFSTGVQSPTQGRIVWKKGKVTNPSEEEYEEDAKVVAAICSSLNGNGGDLRFGTASSGDGDPQDRMVITAEGNVGIGTTNPNGNQLKVTDNTELQELKVLGGVIIDGSTTMSTLTLSDAGSASAPTLEVTQGNVCIGASQMPRDYKLYVTGGETHLDGKLTVATGDVEIASGSLAIGGQVDDTKKLKVTGDTQLDGALTIGTGSVAIGGQVDDTKKLKVTGDTQLDGALTIGTGSVAIASGSLAIGGEVDTAKKLKVTGDTQLDGALTINTGGVEIASGSLAIASGNVTLATGNLAIGGEVDIAKKLKVTGDTQLDGALTIGTGNVTLAAGGLAIGGQVDDTKKLTVTGDTQLDGALTIGTGDVEIASGNVTLTSGSVGIGTTDPQAKLQVSGGAIMPAVGSTEDSGILFPKNPGGGTDDAAWIRYYVREGQKTNFEIGTSNNSDDHIVLQTSGGVGIGRVPDTSNEVKLDVVGKVRADDTVITSDATIKENIQTLKDGLGKILGLRGVSYQWKDDKKAAQETHIGLVAQEVEAIFPELVSTDSQGMKSLSYSKLIAPLIEAIKEQQGQILELVNQVQQQQTQIGQLQALKNG